MHMIHPSLAAGLNRARYYPSIRGRYRPSGFPKDRYPPEIDRWRMDDVPCTSKTIARISHYASGNTYTSAQERGNYHIAPPKADISSYLRLPATSCEMSVPDESSGKIPTRRGYGTSTCRNLGPRSGWGIQAIIHSWAGEYPQGCCKIRNLKNRSGFVYL